MSFTYNSIGFIGLGVTGFPMVDNLAKELPSSTRIHVFDVSSQTVDKLVSESKGRTASCSSSKDVIDRSDIILSMVPESSHVRSLPHRSSGILYSNLASKLLTDCSTIDAATSLSVRSQSHPSV